MNSQLVMDNEEHGYPLCSGWIPILASTHDAVSFRQMEPIGPGRNLDLPPNAKFRADKEYPDSGSLLTLVRANQMPLLNHRDRTQARSFNTLLSNSRVKIEPFLRK